jgi:hypothetical protein
MDRRERVEMGALFDALFDLTAEMIPSHAKEFLS